jgi:hypothetical protein
VPEYFDLFSTTIHALEIFKTNCPWCCGPSTGNLGSPLFNLAIKRGMLAGCPVDNQMTVVRTTVAILPGRLCYSGYDG